MAELGQACLCCVCLYQSFGSLISPQYPGQVCIGLKAAAAAAAERYVCIHELDFIQTFTSLPLFAHARSA